METLVKLAAPAIGTAAGAFTVVGIIYLGMTLAGLLRGGGGEIRKAVAIIVAGLTCIAFPGDEKDEDGYSLTGEAKDATASRNGLSRNQMGIEEKAAECKEAATVLANGNAL